MEFVARGDLRKSITDSQFFNWERLIRFATDIARGLSWLHSRKPPVVHKDLHTRNILVTKYGESCKIADMGLSTIVGQPSTHKLYERISPPEVKEMGFSTKSDIFMLGFIFFEMFSKGIKVEKNILGQLLGYSDSNSFPSSSSIESMSFWVNEPGRESFVKLMKECCHPDPNARPSALQVLKILDVIYSQINVEQQDQIIHQHQDLSHLWQNKGTGTTKDLGYQ